MERESSDEGDSAIRSTKKVRIREAKGDPDVVMELPLIARTIRLWRDCLVGSRLRVEERPEVTRDFDGEGDIDLSEVDIVRSSVDETPSINFSEWVNQILIKDMACTIVVKLLGRNIGYSAFHNKVCSLWKLTLPFQLMDVENGYFLAKFQNSEDFEKVLCQGLWIVYDQYLTVQPWTVDFSTTQAYLSMAMVWIRLPSLPGYLYKRKVLGWFTRMAIYVKLDKALISQVLINEVIQRVKYEYLPTVCFLCGYYGHVKELCTKEESGKNVSEGSDANGKGEQ
ncbi:hypothetical protein Goarm_001016 [Gossypium armourianum]|uniref:DUF4283 domain-containing protein n=1 Tax=Gossypium armourianum TaxID=34283 RepID=A0A7J9KBN2_9ROSI|nr:hypothetical protein [Gossypium armourianum]